MRKFSLHIKPRLAFLAALALFIAQLGAISHAYSHDAALGSSASHQPAASNHFACDACIAFAPLLSGGSPAMALPSIPPLDLQMAASAVPASLVQLPPTLAFRSRAPPMIR